MPVDLTIKTVYLVTQSIYVLLMILTTKAITSLFKIN